MSKKYSTLRKCVISRGIEIDGEPFRLDKYNKYFHEWITDECDTFAMVEDPETGQMSKSLYAHVIFEEWE